jgi:hypothetical protein
MDQNRRPACEASDASGLRHAGHEKHGQQFPERRPASGVARGRQDGHTGARNFCALLRGYAPTVYPCGMFIIPFGAPEGYEWLVALVVLVGLYFAVRSFMRARR